MKGENLVDTTMPVCNSSTAVSYRMFDETSTPGSAHYPAVSTFVRKGFALPTIIRWFKVTHDINADPEIWELREIYGDRAGFIWLECLSIADRNSGIVGPVSDHTRNQLAAKCRSPRTKVGQVLEWCRTRGWLTSDTHWRIAKWRKYNKDLDAKKSPSETVLDSPRQTKHLQIIHPISPPKWGDPEFLIEKYNQETPDTLPAVEKITPARLKKAREYLKIFPDEQFWTDAFKVIGKSQFLQGLRNGNGHNSFIANFDWLLTKGKDGTENVVKIFEGRYGN